MSIVFKVATPGHNVLTETDPNNFSLIANPNDNLPLIKEKVRGIVDISANTNKAINHALGYIPFCLVFKLETGGIWKKLFGEPIDSSGCYFNVDKQNLVIQNNIGAAVTFKYFINYDNFQS